MHVGGERRKNRQVPRSKSAAEDASIDEDILLHIIGFGFVHFFYRPYVLDVMELLELRYGHRGVVARRTCDDQCEVQWRRLQKHGSSCSFRFCCWRFALLRA